MKIFKRESGIKTKKQRAEEEKIAYEARQRRNRNLDPEKGYLGMTHRPVVFPDKQPIPKRKLNLTEDEYYALEKSASPFIPGVPSQKEVEQNEQNLQRRYRGKPVPKKGSREIDVEKEATNRLRRRK